MLWKVRTVAKADTVAPALARDPRHAHSQLQPFQAHYASYHTNNLQPPYTSPLRSRATTALPALASSKLTLRPLAREPCSIRRLR